MNINSLFNLPGSKHRHKRLGRGIGSGHGKTCGRGAKGQKSRSGVSIRTEGGQTPLIKRLPKVGFTSSRKKINIITYDKIAKFLEQNSIKDDICINSEFLKKNNLVRNNSFPVKLLLGKITKITVPREFSFEHYSKSARQAIQDSEGKII